MQNVGIESEIASRVVDLTKEAELRGYLHSLPNEIVRGFSEGEQTTKLAEDLGIPINEGFTDGLIISENAPTPWALEDLKIWILGPNRYSLERLQTKWLKWLEENVSKPVMRGGIDTSVPNLSSIMLLVEAGGKRFLLPGDGTGRDVLEGLKNLKKLDASDSIHVDVLKLPHHGSKRNVSEEFFEKVTADTYVISALKSNPDYETLEWIVKNAERQQRKIQILSTNQTDSTRQLEQKYDQQQYGFTMIYMRKDQHYITI